MSATDQSLSFLPSGLRRAVKVLQEHQFDKELSANVAAVIISGGKILSVGVNSWGDPHPLQVKHKTHEFVHSVHAETDAILRVRGKVDLAGSKIFVARKFKGPLVIGNAKPCYTCQAILHAYGVTKAIYTISGSEFGTMRVVDPRTDPGYADALECRRYHHHHH